MDEQKDDKSPRYRKLYKILSLGLVVHFLLLFAVFDIYFSSPLEHGMTPIKSTSNPPAKRVVLFVADGLRSEAIYGEDKEDRIPFLANIMRSHGSWGVAHTRVPTESRPGHVAMLAGIYEDPSAILKGWKANPVYFDSVINESSNAWCWGSPDIVNLFNRDELPHIHLHTYSSRIEDFGTTDTGMLDRWVFNKVYLFLNEVRNCSKNCDNYFSIGNLYFLHLLGIDTAGHGYKPHSKEYIDNIKLVDEHVNKISALFNTVYEDNSTAFVFTSDHGMTDWGSHGSGSVHETDVPIIAWGSGIKTSHERQDIFQIDIAPLLSSLIGVNIPTNSLGVVPLNYLSTYERNLAKIQLSNVLQLLEIFNVKRLKIENNALVFIAFSGLSKEMLSDIIEKLYQLYENGRYNEVIISSRELVLRIMNGIEYYQNYYQYPLLLAVSIGMIGWIIFLITCILDSNEKVIVSKRRFDTLLIFFMLISFGLCYMHKFPFAYYLYFSFPSVMCFAVWQNVENLVTLFRQFKKRGFKGNSFSILMYIIGTELLVYGFFDRSSFTLLMILVGFWIFLSDSLYQNSEKREKILWICFCSVLSIFPLLPVMKTTFNVPMYLLGCLAWILLFYEIYTNRMKHYNQFRKLHVHYRIFHIQFVCFISAIAYVLCLENKLISNDSNLKYISWFFLVIPVTLIPSTSRFVAVRLATTFFGFAPFYVLVSSNYELLFSAFYVALLCNWLIIESKTFQVGNSSRLIYYVNFEVYKGKEKFNSDMFRRAFLFMVFIFIGFFGTGNIASLNSFDPMWVRAFLTVFSPFKMMGLILLKIAVPFIFACCVFRAINSIGKENILAMFCIILIFSDLMVLQFLYLITNVGSWLDIGTSLSHFIVMEGFVTILLLLYAVAHVLTTVSYVK